MTATKLDLRHGLADLYRAGAQPSYVEVPELTILMVDGRGDPNGPGFADAVQAMFSVAYAVKFDLRRNTGFDFSVMPLEALWSSPEGPVLEPRDRDAWEWTLIVVQPDAVTDDEVETAREKARAKRPSEAVERIRLGRFEEGLAAQVLHLGPYSAEAPTIERLHAFIASEGLVPSGRHHEIYIGDPRRSAPERLKTIIRQPCSHS